MENKKTNLSAQTKLAVEKGTEAVRAATKALDEANAALESIRELDLSDLELVAGGTSEWENTPGVEEHDYPVTPNP